MFIILHFVKFVFKNLNLGFGELHIMSQPNLSALYLNLKECYCVTAPNNYYSLRQSNLDLSKNTSFFCNETLSESLLFRFDSAAGLTFNRAVATYF
jgi:hypothetical protein